MRDEQKQALAEKIAAMLREEPGVGGAEQVWKAIDDIGRRLDAIESSLEETPSPGPNISLHPSLEKYAIPEPHTSANGKEAICDFEPHGRPCDKCSMCSSHGF